MCARTNQPAMQAHIARSAPVQTATTQRDDSVRMVVVAGSFGAGALRYKRLTSRTPITASPTPPVWIIVSRSPSTNTPTSTAMTG